MKLRVIFSVVALVASIFSGIASAYPACSFGHCTAFDPLMKKLCAAKYKIPESAMTAQHTILSYENGVECICPCSCVVGETLMKLFDGEDVLARTIRKGDTFYLPQASRTDAMVYGAAGGDIEKGEVQEILFGNNKLLRVSLNHTFVSAKGKIVTAEKLRLHDRVLDVHGKPVSVIQTRRLKGYTGSLFNFIVNEQSRKPSDHIIVANDMQSGDWLLQTTNDQLKDEMNLRFGRVETLDEMIGKNN